MDDEIIGRCYVATDAPSTLWVVTQEFRTDMNLPHSLLLKSGEHGTTKLIAINALTDHRLYRMVE